MKYDSTKELLFKLVSKKNSPHSFIFYGLNSSKIEKIAKELAIKILNTEEAKSIDMLEIKIDKKSISVDDIRVLNQEILKKPEISKNKVVIVHDAQKMTVEAQNSFLKSLEDVMENTYIILLSKKVDNILKTILSRCLIIKFGKIDYEEYKNDFKYANLNNEQLHDLYILSKGNIDISKSILNKELVYNIYIYILENLNYLSNKDLIGIFEIQNQIHNFKENMELFISIYVSLLRDVLIYSELKEEKFIYNIMFKEEIITLSSVLTKSYIKLILEQLLIFKNRVNSNMNLEVCNRIFILNVYNNEKISIKI